MSTNIGRTGDAEIAKNIARLRSLILAGVYTKESVLERRHAEVRHLRDMRPSTESVEKNNMRRIDFILREIKAIERMEVEL